MAQPRCACGLEVVIRTSWTNRNPGRRFYGCPTLIIPGLLRSRNELEEIIAIVEEKRLRNRTRLLTGVKVDDNSRPASEDAVWRKPDHVWIQARHRLEPGDDVWISRQE
ncbi:hypothetical protein Tco_1487002 [Tanacetum coccineum]